ncbi:ribulokinase [Clostridium swellfunianum]|uniref:ribulokinase n=1 Tax=Clostridium swellfunianum TaxID=1367462 RepID=UPI00202F519A|nr:ribulokinase [Clostridium swellfunianum]MCM0650086.1 ribulokinase [Clostridium swellfunianum]
MSNKKYAIGLDFGTQSGRAVLVEVETGMEVAEAVTPYKCGVIDEYLPETNLKLPQDFALQNPEDYIEVLETVVPKVMKETGISPEDIIGIGIDFTACTILPVTKDGTALCMLSEYRANPHAWVKLWKHHAAQREANDFNKIAGLRNESFMFRYGGKISSEWLVTKIWQILKEAPEIYSNADSFMEAGDWVTMQLTGINVRNSCAAGYKALWSKSEGYPDKKFFKALDPRLENLVEEKLNSPILPIGSKAGLLRKEMAAKMGLREGISVSVANVDAHVAAPAVKVVEPGKMLMIMGTSTCHMLLSKENKLVKGVGGVVEDGIIPGFYGYEAGQAAVGDIFEWFVDNQVPESYMKEAGERGINIHVLLEEKASKLKPGESGLLALDWWNGNRSTLVDADLTGMILGATLLTKPEEIYRALIEATAFGTNAIIEAFREEDIAVDALYACGGLPEKNKMLMQIYADVTNMEIRISASKQTPALGAAMFGAVAAGKENGGYDSLLEAAEKMARLKDEVFKPIPENVKVYGKLYLEYKKLYDYFGKGENNVMKVLKALKSND